MTYEGNIAGLDLVARLIELGQQKFTGAMRFENEGIIKIIYFKAGDVLSASTNDRTDSLDEILVRASKITRDHIKQALAKRKESETLGDALLSLGFIARKELTWARRIQVIGIIRSILGWPDGNYMILADYVPKREEGTLFPLPQIILELIVTDPDRAKFEQALDSGNAIYLKPEGFDASFSALGLNQDAEEIAAQIDGLRTASEVASNSGKDTFNVFKLLYALEQLGLVRLVEVSAPGYSPSDLKFDEDDAADRAAVVGAFTGFEEPAAEPQRPAPEPTAPEPEPAAGELNMPSWDHAADASEPIQLAENAPAIPGPVPSAPEWKPPTAPWESPAPIPIPSAISRDRGPIEPLDPAEVRSQVRENLGHDDEPAERSRRPLLALVLIVLVVAGGAYGAFWWWIHRASSEPVAAAVQPHRPPVRPPPSPPAPATSTSETRSAASTTGAAASAPATSSGAPATPAGSAAGKTTGRGTITTTHGIERQPVLALAPETRSADTSTATRPAQKRASSAPAKAQTSPATSGTETRIEQPTGSRPLTITNIPTGSSPAGIQAHRSNKAATPAAASSHRKPAPAPEPNARGDALRERYDAMARENRSRISASTPYAIQFELVCQTESVTRALAASSSKVWFIPTTYRGTSCYRVFWGHYASSEAAAAATSEIPAELRQGSSPAVVRVTP